APSSRQALGRARRPSGRATRQPHRLRVLRRRPRDRSRFGSTRRGRARGDHGRKGRDPRARRDLASGPRERRDDDRGRHGDRRARRRSTVAELKGDVKLTSQRGRGVAVDLCVPISISAITALVLETGGSRFALPLDAVRRAMRLSSRDISRSADRDSVVVDGVVVPFLRLASVAAIAGADGVEASWSAIVVASGTQTAVIGADRLVGTSSIVLRPLPKAAGSVPIAAGVSLDDDGHPQLVLDPRGLVAAAHGGQIAARAAASAEARAPILIVDDSLTTRMLE